ncbi:MAG TPA: HAMP domain-containing sensor histidine kinase [Draconibacterium sp.]|nr:HAMP domain-containing sensor histidine kinase [Draconibacterium sp.]
MTIPLISCFSDDNDNLNYLLHEINKYYGSVINQTIFTEKLSFFKSFKDNKVLSKEIQLLVIDIGNKTNDYIQFIQGVHHLCPSASKLIIAENNQLIEIENSVENNNSMLFLKRPWTNENLKGSLDMASKSYSNSNRKYINKQKELNFNEQVEEKVNQRLQKLIDANLAKDSFLSIISHDLKSPFTALQGISEILLNEWEDLTDDIKLELVGDLHKTSVDTFKLLETMLEWTKLQKEKLEVTINEVKVHNLVNSTLKVSENNASVKNIKIHNKIDREINVRTDENMIATVFRNLISNAVKFTQPGGKINITAKTDKDFCTFCVADNGPGIDKPHILELFNRGSRKKINGNASAFNGLGLLISKDFVEKSGGQIWLETQKEQGSKFFFTVPCQS